MKTTRFAVLALALAFCALSPGLSAGEVFSRPHDLRAIKTKHFDIVFAKEEQASAERLASYADEVYAEVAAKLRVPMKLRIPVVLTPDSDELNGYTTPFPSLRIVLFQAPISPNSGFVAYRDDLRKLFMHELTHAVSCDQGNAFWTFMVGVFGDVLYLGNYLAPAAFIEGVTVSLESDDGFGRANESSVAAVIQQSIIEDSFPSFLEASKAKDGYPYDAFYKYGGWFSRYLREGYGDDSYAQLWKELGAGNAFWDILGFKGAFSRVYGMPVEKAWEDFRRWMSPTAAILTATEPLDDGYGYILASASHGSAFYWADRLGIWELKDGKKRRLADSNSLINRLAVSPDGSLLSGEWLDSAYGVIAADLRPAILPYFASLPVGLGLRIDQAFRGEEAARGPRLSLYAGLSLY